MLRLLLLVCVSCSSCEDDPVRVEMPNPEPARETSWTELEFPAAEGAMGASLSASERGLLATWIEPVGEGHRVRFANYDDTWGESLTVAEGPDLIANWADFPRASLGGDGSVYVHHLHRSGEAAYAYEIRLSRLGAGSFESLGVVHRDGTPTEHGFVSMVPTGEGVRLFWLDGRATLDDGATQVFTAEVGETIGEAAPLDDRVCDCCQTDAVMTPGGPLVAFRDRSDAELRDVSFARWEGAGFSEPRLVHHDGWEIAGCPVNGPQVGATGDALAVAWFTGATGGSVQVAFDEGEQFGEPILVDGRQPPGRVDLVMLGDDGAAVSWLARGDEGGEVRVRYVGRSGDLGAPTRVAQIGLDRASGFPVMARWRDDLYVVHRRGDGLRLARLPIDSLPRSGGVPEPEPELRVRVGDRLPTTLVEAAEGEVDLAERGVRVVAFYARWCQPCREELRLLEQLRTESDVSVVAVSIDEGSLARAERVARAWGFEGEVVRDLGAAAVLGIPPLPGLFVMNPQGGIVIAESGRLADLDAVRAALRQ